MPRLGIITDEITEDFEHALAVCSELGVRELELRSLWGTNIVDLDDEQIARVASLVADGGFRVCSIASPFLKCHLHGDGDPTGRTHSASATSRDEQWRVLDRSLAVAERLDAPIVRAFSFWRLDDPVAARDEILAVLTEATARVAAAGKHLGLENEYACNIATGVEAAWYLERIPDQTLGLIWDPGNIAALDVVPSEAEYRAVADRVIHVHIKDAIRIGGAEFTVPSEGACTWGDQLRWLADDGYTGVLSMETHFAIDGDHERASRESLTALAALANDNGFVDA